MVCEGAEEEHGDSKCHRITHQLRHSIKLAMKYKPVPLCKNYL
jgi:hypothetical protein